MRPRTNVMRYLALVALVGCGDNVAPPDAPIARVEVALVPNAAPDAVDVLFVIQDSCCALSKQNLLKDAMVQLVDELAARPRRFAEPAHRCRVIGSRNVVGQ